MAQRTRKRRAQVSRCIVETRGAPPMCNTLPPAVDAGRTRGASPTKKRELRPCWPLLALSECGWCEAKHHIAT